MFLGMQDLILPKSNQNCPNLNHFAQLLPKKFPRGCGDIRKQLYDTENEQ